MKMKIMKRIKYLLVSALMLATTSCGELYEMFISGELQISSLNSVALSHHEIDLLVGDTIVFELDIDPDTFMLQQPTCRWTLSDPTTKVVSMIGKRLIAREEGEVMVRLEATPPGLSPDDLPADSVMRDSCWVTVARREKVDLEQYPYEMLIIGQLQVDGEVVTDADMVAGLQAVVGSEVRGEGVLRSAFGIPYVELMIRGGEYGEKGIIEFYDKENLHRVVFIEFEFDGDTYGTLSDPIIFNIVTTNDAPLWRLETSSKVH